jgi:hypothetical protein
MKLADKEEAEKGLLCKHYEGKVLYAGLQNLYVEIYREINETLLREHAKSNEEFHEQRRRKRNASDSEGIQTKRSDNNAGIRNPRVPPQVPTRNYFASLRTQMESGQFTVIKLQI